MTDKELLPCPFCGGTGDTEHHRVDLGHGSFRDDWYVNCTNSACRATIRQPEDNPRDAIAAWNTRADLTKTEACKGCREKVAMFMVTRGFATGNGDTIDDLLDELSWQIEEIRSRPASPAPDGGIATDRIGQRLCLTCGTLNPKPLPTSAEELARQKAPTQPAPQQTCKQNPGNLTHADEHVKETPESLQDRDEALEYLEAFVRCSYRNENHDRGVHKKLTRALKTVRTFIQGAK